LSDKVLVTGGSGFVGVHCILALLREGFQVRTTVRSLAREPEVREMLAAGGAEPGDALEFAVADLMHDAGWDKAVADCRYVLHVASPFPAREPKHEDELIVPAREGALRVLRAARDAKVERVVLTSSFAAIGYGPQRIGHSYTEEDWTDAGDGQKAFDNLGAYVKSKTLAERAAWDFIDREGEGLELAVVNPAGVLGPVLGTDLSTSIELVLRLLTGKVPGLAKVTFGMVDVRDVADVHVQAMTNPAANGQRFLAVADGALNMPEVAALLRTKLGDVAAQVPTRVLPDWMVRLAAVFDPSLKEITQRLGNHRQMSNEKIKTVLGMYTRSRPAMMPGRARGSVTRVKVVSRLAPRSFDASRSGPPTRSNATNSGRIMSGR